MGNQKIVGIDIGNTVIKSAEFLQNDLGELKKWNSIQELVNEYEGAAFVISSVANQKLDIEIPIALSLSYLTPLPIKIDYKTPETLGVDRIAAAVGAWSIFPNRNLLIIDGGTCITYDLVTKDGFYRGGVISPGMKMRLKAMNSFTSGLPLVESGDPELPGKSTTECLQLGAMEGLRLEIEGFLGRFNKKYGDLQVVTTGGFLPSFESDFKKPIFASSKIVMTGLHAIWKFNEGN